MNPLFSDDRLLDEIEKKRKEMITAAMETGFLSDQTLTASQELDRLLNSMQSEVVPVSK